MAGEAMITLGESVVHVAVIAKTDKGIGNSPDQCAERG